MENMKIFDEQLIKKINEQGRYYMYFKHYYYLIGVISLKQISRPQNEKFLLAHAGSPTLLDPPPPPPLRGNNLDGTLTFS